MFILKKLLTPFLLPPGIFVTLAFLTGLLLLRGDRRRASLWFVLALVMWAAGMKPVGNMALTGLEYAYLPPNAVSGDAIVVLGGGIQDSVPEFFGGAALSATSVERTAEAARIYNSRKLPIIVTGGAVFSRSSEARELKKYLMTLGVPAEMILMEDKARDTWENAFFSKKICDEKGYEKIILVTSAYHMKRSVWSFEKAGFNGLTPWPASYRSSRRPDYVWVDYLPGSFDLLRLAMHERLGLLFYRLKSH